MKIFVDTRSGVPIYRQIVQQVEKGIIGGLLKPGEQLPTVREVALKLTINPNTAARAYRELEHAGVIESIQGRGTFVAVDLPRPGGKEKELIIKKRIEELVREAGQLNISPGKLELMLKAELEKEQK